MAYDAIQALRAAGTMVDQLSDAQREVLATLTPAEVSVLTDVQNRIAAGGPDVEGHLFGIVVF